MDSGLLAALGPGMTAVVTCAAAHYIVRAGLRCLSDTYSRGLTIPKGAVPGRVRGSGHMAPTYFCRFPGSKSDGSCGSALLSTSPHPEEPSEARRLEGWRQSPYLRPSFETRLAALLRMRVGVRLLGKRGTDGR